MAAAYILMNIESGKVGKAHTAIKGIKGVKEAYIVAGTFDIIAFVEANSLEQLSQRILMEIQTISGVRSTTTAIVFQ
ncbi:MAG: Lrp/AsnC ligand binding domain-containing protein [Nitrospira sp.]|nr:Lrp/AsnC ligand binding domain-containing protein [Nitrospira sp.]